VGDAVAGGADGTADGTAGLDDASTDTGTGNVTRFEGTVVSGSFSGSVAITIEGYPLGSLDGSSVTAMGIITLTTGETETLSGTYDPNTGALSLSNSTGFGLTGGFQTLDANLSGSFFAPNDVGNFVAEQLGSFADVTVYCGTFHGLQTATFNLVSWGQTIEGYLCFPGEDAGFRSTCCPFRGTYTAGTFDAAGLSTAQCGGTGGGTFAANAVTGTWQNNQGGAGTFSGTVCN
jgi:hypothetical protein